MNWRVAGLRRSRLSVTVTAAAIFLLAAGVDSSSAQSVRYAHVVDWIGASCGKDIDKFCSKVNFGGGRIQKCLGENQRYVSPTCNSAVTYLTILLERKAAARAAIVQICAEDIKVLCPNVPPGDGNRLECLYSVTQNVSAPCRQAAADTGYDLALSSEPASGPGDSSLPDLVNSLRPVEQSAAGISAADLHRLALQGIDDPSRASPVNRPPLSEQLNRLAQATVAVRFDADSARIQPDSFRAVALMADALYHPYLQAYRFLIVGHTEAGGRRRHNLKLSQQRADAIRQALIKPFGISPSRIRAIGLGEEQLLNPASPEAVENRRVQLINVGK